MAAQAPMDFEPGQRMQYCNTNYYLLGMVIEAVSGQTYAQYLDDHVFQPSGHVRLTARWCRTRGARDESGATRTTSGTLRNAEFTSDTWAFAEGGVITTAEDLAKLDAALYGETLLSRQQHRPDVDADQARLTAASV